MIRLRARARGFLLVETLVMVAVGSLIVAILGKFILDTVRLQRIAAAHANRLATMESLGERIQRDALAAIEWNVDGQTLILHTLSESGPADVVYAFSDERVCRSGPQGDAREWQAERLRFAHRIDRGPRGGVLCVDFVEQPPAGAVERPSRTSTAAFFLPGPSRAEAAP